MSSHRRSTQYFGRAFGPRRALLRGLVTSLVEHGRIRTTVEKAKEVRRHVEKAITVGKKGDLNSYRILLQRFPNKDTVSTIVKDLAVRFKDRNGGYTRVIKLGPRPGDMAEMAFVEFVDFDHTQFLKSGKKAEGKKADAADKEKAKAEKKATKTRVQAAAAARKTRRKIQNKSRAEARMMR